MPADMSDPRAPLYFVHNLRPVHRLHYDWTGWPTPGTTLPPATLEAARATAAAWEADGLSLVTPHATSGKVQLLFDVTPEVSPAFFCMRVKGRLQHALRKAGAATDFSRKVGFWCLGENTSAVVREYIRNQVGRTELADPRFRDVMARFTVIRDERVLTEPSESNSGRYWYNLHVVLVTADRVRITNPLILGRIRDAAVAAAAGHGHRLGALAVMPDHVHLAVRGHIDQSPREIALLFQNALARGVGCRAWQDGFYVGTFSEYGLDVLRMFDAES